MDETLNMAAETTGAAADGWDDVTGVEDGEIGAESVTEPAEPAAEQDAPGEPAPEPDEPAAEAAGEKFAVKYNGQVMNLTRDEMTTLAQKGMNYDKISQRLQQALDGPEHRLIERMAAASGLSTEAYLARAEEMLANQFVREQGEQGIPEQAARQMWQDRQELAEYRAMAARAASRQDAAAQQEQAMQAEFRAFVAEYPNVETLPPEVIAIKQADPAESITSAYRKWELEQLRTRMQAKDADKTNRETAPGSAAGTGKPASDPFLDGWDDI